MGAEACPEAFGPNPAADVSVPFLIDSGAFRGRLVRLTAVATEILDRHNDPEPVAALLAEAMVSAVALAGGLKYTGVFTLQIQGKGPVHMLVTDVTSEGNLRGCAKYDAEALAAEMHRAQSGGLTPHLVGPGGHLAFTVDQGPDTERYQGIVELTGESLAEAVHHYFRQSEQLESALKVAVGAPKAPGEPWTAAALLLQRMPEEGGLIRLAPKEELDDAWRTAVILMGSVKNSELLDLSLAPERLLTRLFITVGVVPAARRPIQAKCRCSRERSEGIIASFPMEEVQSYAEDGKIHMTCEFCRADYDFAVKDLERIVEKHRAAATSDVGAETEEGETS
ncbi:MAG: Hsp33 family molecular chaperone HslO [Rhodospirillaceae bacterium]|nr:Hsp33 family molecular chaperone HslO [Rhodospirillaceae bacterium]